MDFRYKSHPRSTMYYESRISIIMITSSHFSSFSEVKSSLQRLYRDVLNFQCVCLFFKLNSFTTINVIFFFLQLNNDDGRFSTSQDISKIKFPIFLLQSSILSNLKSLNNF